MSMPIADGFGLEEAAEHDVGSETAASADSWQGPPPKVRRKTPDIRTETALSLLRHDLESRIAFLERICTQAESYRNLAIATRYARALRDAQEELLLLPFPRMEGWGRDDRIPPPNPLGTRRRN